MPTPIAVTAANVLMSAAGQSIPGIAASAITAGQPVYKLVIGTYAPALAVNPPVSPLYIVSGIALNGAGANQPVNICTSDPAFVTGGVIASGVPVLLGATAGAITQTPADVVAGAVCVSLGVGNTDLTLNFKIAQGGVK